MRFFIIVILTLCLTSCSAYGEIVKNRATAKKETPDIKLPNEITDYPFHWFKLNQEESKRIISADLTGDGIDEIIIAQEYRNKKFIMCAFIFIYNQNRELMYKDNTHRDAIQQMKVINRKLYGISDYYNPMACIVFKEGKFCWYVDKDKKLIHGEVVYVNPTGWFDDELNDPSNCARLFVMRYYEIEGDYTNDEKFPADVQLMGSEAIVTVDYNENRHIIWLEAPSELPPEGVWSVIKMEIVSGRDAVANNEDS